MGAMANKTAQGPEKKFLIANGFRRRFYDPSNGETLRSDVWHAFKGILRTPKEEIIEFREDVNANSMLLDGVSLAMDSCGEKNQATRARMLDTASAMIEGSERHALGALPPEEAAAFCSMANGFKLFIDEELKAVNASIITNFIEPRDGVTLAQVSRMSNEVVEGKMSVETERYLKQKMVEKRRLSIRHAGIGGSVFFLASSGFLVSSLGLMSVAITNGIQGACGVIAMFGVYEINKFRSSFSKLNAVADVLKRRDGRKQQEANEAGETGRS